MAKAHPIWTNFTGGEFSPLLEGRVDLAKYFNACRKLQNMLVHPHGPASNRSGFRYLGSTKYPNKKARLIPFQFSTEQAYICEFGNQYIRFWMNKGQITILDSAIEALLHGDGLDASKTIVDSSSNEHTVTAHGDCQIDTEYKKFGTGSISFPGTTGSYVTIPKHAAWNMGTGKLCIDHWLRSTEWPDIGKGIYLFSQYQDENNYVIFYIYRGGASDYILYCTIKSGGEVILNLGGAWSPPLVGTWLHLALIRGWGGNANDWAITVGGKAAFTDTVSCTWPDLTGDLYLGHYEDSPYPVMSGRMDEFCWTKGKTWWEENFIPPTLEYPQAQGGTPYEISSPYLEEHLPYLKFVQSADVMYLVHSYYAPRKLTRTGHTSWTLSLISFTAAPSAWGKTAAITGASQENPVVVTAVAHGLENGASISISGVVGMTELNGKAYTVANETADTLELQGIDGTGYTAYDSGGIIDEREQPSCITFFEERLALAATPAYPQTIWPSKSGDYENMTTGANDDDAIAYSIAADQVNAIKWLSPGKRLIMGTVGGEWNFGASRTDEALTPTNVRAIRETAHGSVDIQAARIGHVALFVQKAGKKIRELAYSFEVDNYVAPDMTLLAEHITKPTVKEVAYQQEPFSILWCVRSDGALLGLTYKREQEVIAWHRHITDGNFENIAVIPGPEADELYVIAKREINGSTKRYVELLESPFDDTDTESAFFVDSGLSYDGEPTSTIGGLDHLEGEEVTILADGATHPNKTVSGNSITLDREASKVQVGLGYTSILQTMRLEAGVREGTAQGRIKRISKVVIRLYKTLGCKIGPDENTLDTIFFRDSSMPMDAPPELFTGDKEIDYPEGYETDAHITVVQDLPLPITVVALMPRIRTAEGE